MTDCFSHKLKKKPSMAETLQSSRRHQLLCSSFASDSIVVYLSTRLAKLSPFILPVIILKIAGSSVSEFRFTNDSILVLTFVFRYQAWRNNRHSRSLSVFCRSPVRLLLESTLCERSSSLRGRGTNICFNSVLNLNISPRRICMVIMTLPLLLL